jgi:hypothetical protein
LWISGKSRWLIFEKVGKHPISPAIIPAYRRAMNNLNVESGFIQNR